MLTKLLAVVPICATVLPALTASRTAQWPSLGREPEALDRELTESMARVRAVFEDEMSRWGAA